MTIKLPRINVNAEGEFRKVGLELEFAGVELSRTAELIRELYGGTVKERHRYEFDIIDTDLGDFRVELDALILRKMARQDFFKTVGLPEDKQGIKKSVEEIVDKLAKTVVPIEVVMPPVPFKEIEKLEKLRQKLQQHKAEGTKVSLMHIFGMHLNIECPDLQTDTLLTYLRAFLVLHPWMIEKLDIDFSRRVSPFVDPFPQKYVELVLDIDYEPDREYFIDDYLEFNPTRNRPLDFMPIFALFDKEKVKQVLDDEKNKARPTFHYRLPNSKIDDDLWSFTEEWNYWTVVEDLADDDEMLEKLCRLYLLRRDKMMVSFKKEWAETVTILLDLDELS